MDEDHKQEIEDELRQEEKEEPMRIWISSNHDNLEEDYIKQLPVEEQPLDDETPDFMDNHSDDFDRYCKQQYNEMD